MHTRSRQSQHILAKSDSVKGNIGCWLLIFSCLWHRDLVSVMLQDYEPPSGEIKSAIEKDFGSVGELSKKFNAKAATVQVCLNQFVERLKISLLS